MPRYDFSAPRLFVAAPLTAGEEISLDKDQSNYLLNVLRLADGATVLAFNGRDGEWVMRLHALSRKALALRAETLSRAQTPAGDLHYLFAPLKHARLDYMVQKAVEMGVSRISPVMTHRTQATRVNLDRMRANAIEAAEQCGVLGLPDISDVIRLDKLLAGWPKERRLIFCDEEAEVADPVKALQAMAPGPLAVVIGPEGGFDPQERAALLRLPLVTRLSLGPRILRADTAAVAALALTQAVAGDWATS
ncbi:MAG: 16S rRNA (uracil(1498)-N(3))-methyltransferase [Beijerinckiaceae bacterium]|nr:16S rRNA (uracil(1498)-N(3))-methyltransferase [Beijerinckiaceae bacterium]